MKMESLRKNIRTHWHGKWIWANYIKPRRIKTAKNRLEYIGILEEEKNVFVLVRKVFFIEKHLKKARLFITADSRYKLFINGKYIGRGINRCEPYLWYYNEYDITPYLKEGKNVIAIHARYYGMDFAYYNLPPSPGVNKLNSGKGGVLFDVQCIYEEEGNKKEIWFGSDKSARIMVNKAERSDVALKNDALGFVEEFDSRKQPKDWNEIDFDDSTWEIPLELDYPIKTLILDENAPLFEEFVKPYKILNIGENEDILKIEEFEEEELEEMDFNIFHMLEGAPQELMHFKITGKENLIQKPSTEQKNEEKNEVCLIEPIGENASSYVLSLFFQFEKEMVGYPQIIVEGPEGTIIDIIPAEKQENNLPLIHFMNERRGSRLILRGGKQFFEQWDWEGYLYMLIKIRNLTGPLKIYKIGTNRTRMQVSGKGEFITNDTEINKLWEACAYTLECCAIDGYLDCPSREQRSYLGDAYTESLLAFTSFGEGRLTKKLIYDAAAGQRKDGICYSFHPGDYELQTHIIPDYTLYWIQIAYDYYEYFGEEEILTDLYPYFKRAMEWFLNYFDNNKKLLQPNLPYWVFIDWSFPHTKPGYNAILNTQFMDCLIIVGKIALKIGDEKTANKYLMLAEELKQKIDTTFWDENEGCYKDYLLEGQLHGKSFHTNAYLPLKGITNDKEKINRIIENIFQGIPEEEEKEQIQKLQQNLQSHHYLHNLVEGKIRMAQPFFMHHVHKFLAKMNRFDIIMKFFKLAWIPMIKIRPHGTIWETWSQDGSLCHAWSATPGYDLSTYWLGVSPLEPGFQEVLISPTFYALTKVSGIFPTTKGDIKIAWKKEEKGEKIEIALEINTSLTIEKVLFQPRPLENNELIEMTIEEEEKEKIKVLPEETEELFTDGIILHPGKTTLTLTYYKKKIKEDE